MVAAVALPRRPRAAVAQQQNFDNVQIDTVRCATAFGMLSALG
jgi:hypothetical protein